MTTYIEDLLQCLANDGIYMFSTKPMRVNKFDERVVNSLSENVSIGKGMTLKQRSLTVRLCKKYKDQLSTVFGTGIDNIIDAENFKMKLVDPYVAVYSVNVIDKKIYVKFPYDDQLVGKIRGHRSLTGMNMVNWSADTKSWEFDLEEANVMWIRNNVVSDQFIVDDTVNKYVSEISEIFNRLEEFVPTIVKTDQGYSFKNVHPTIPQPTSTDIKEVCLLARYYGITTWEENVNNLIETANFSPILTKFLTESTDKSLEIDPNKFSIDQFTDLFKYHLPVLIVVPGGEELQSLRTWYFWLKTQNFQEKDISVMFRLDNGTGSAFNDIVKENKLNNPISDNTKVVFISQKMPKPIIKSGIEFKFVVNLSPTWSSHYSINQYLSTMDNVIKFAPLTNSGNHFAQL